MAKPLVKGIGNGSYIKWLALSKDKMSLMERGT